MAPSLRKKLIEVALPLEAINKASAREKGIRPIHPSALHMWWARRPHAAARAVIFAQLVDDPSSLPELFHDEKAQEAERQRLFGILQNLVLWENTTNEQVLRAAREEIWKSWRRTCADNTAHPGALELFNPQKLPEFHDPFAGGGTLPLEAQRLGLVSYGSDLNSIAALINKAAIEIPQIFLEQPPVNPQWGEKSYQEQSLAVWQGATGLVEDIRYYGNWMRKEAENRIGYLFPRIQIDAQKVAERQDLRKYEGRELTVIAWLWARTVKSPNPAFSQVEVPLTSTFVLSNKPGKEAHIEPVLNNGQYYFNVKIGKLPDTELIKNGTKRGRGANFQCLLSGTPIDGDYIKTEAKAGRMAARMLAIVAEGDRERVYLSPTEDAEAVARKARPQWEPDLAIKGSTRYMVVKPYGMEYFSHLFTPRQLVALTTLSDLTVEARERVRRDALNAGLPKGASLTNGGTGANAYADAVATYLAFGVSKTSNRANMLATWMVHEQCPGHLFRRHAIPMSWDFCEANTISGPSGSFWSLLDDTASAIRFTYVAGTPGHAAQADATQQNISFGKVISTDPPYYDNVPYADLSDFFYVWLRRCLRPVYPELFATLEVFKSEELVAFPHRHQDNDAAEEFFLNGMTQAMRRLAEQAHPAFPITIYYAFKQAEEAGDEGTASTGWETFLGAVIRAGLSISGTWPIRTERKNRSRNQASNALASSIILCCRPRMTTSASATRRDFVGELKKELPIALANLQHGNIAPVDLAQAVIGPGMAIYTKYESILDAEGRPLSVRQALALINQMLDEVLTEQEGDFDGDSRWAVTWFEQTGFSDGDYGLAEQLSKSKNTSVARMMQAGILSSKGGKVRLFKPEELAANWDSDTDARLTTWEIVHQLIRSLESGGEGAAAALVAKLGAKAEVARELAYRLYTVCERKKRAAEALSYNGLVQSWPEITRLAREAATERPTQPQLI